MTAVALELRDPEEARALFGPQDRYLRLVRDRYGVEVYARDLKVHVKGDEPAAGAAVAFLNDLLARARSAAETLTPEVVEALLDQAPGGRPPSGRMPPPGGATVVPGIRLKTAGQQKYMEAVAANDLVFSIGPAGTGKTFLAVVAAVQALKQGEVQRIVLCRPAVEAGEKLGFLPGDLQAKVNPYMRPLYDALYAVLDFETVKKYIEREVVEVVPLAYMRGRTLSKAFIILDEAQNTTKPQMKMFLTRMGEGSKIVVTGDVTQIDLPPGVTSGLVHVQSILKSVKGIAFANLTEKDIVRHPLVGRIIDAYEGKERGRARSRG